MIRIAVVLSIILLISCDSHKPMWTKTNDWYHPGKFGELMPHSNRWEPIDSFVVIDKHRQEAVETLKKSQFVQLNKEEILHFHGSDIPINDNEHVYLVRLVYLSKGFTNAYIRHKQLWLSHGTFGKHPLPMKKSAMLVKLSFRPEKVFLTCAMDE